MSKKKNENEITRNEHVFICGGTGSGKSIMTEVYLAGENFPYVVKIDTKGEYFERQAAGEPAWRGLVEGEDYEVIFRLKDLQFAEKNKIIYVPDYDEQEFEFYDAFFKWVYERQNTTVWIDELMSIVENAHKIPRFLKAIYTRGRSRMTTLWACSQRCNEIPNIILANTQVFFVFTMNLEADRKKLVMMTDQKDFMYKPEKFYFWFYKIGNNKPVMATLKLRG
jgi:hypothetical protein